MTKVLQVYECEVCGNLVEMLRGGAGKLVCCGQPMALREENTKDASVEKHVPVIEKTAHGVKVSVGSAVHPMEDDHYIEWIEVHWDGRVRRQFLEPGQPPQATFNVEDAVVTARAYCNLHGLWKA